jgi:MerR family Zn(II)-responsive transcriptional regulator of zntA
MESLLKIGEVSKRANITVETLRYYQSEDLLVPKRKTESGYRLYSEQELQKLSFILHSKKIGFSLSEIKQLLSLRTDKDQHTCEEVKNYTGNKINEIESKICDLQKMRQALSSLHNACCGGKESAKQCTILNSLDDPELFTI